MPTARTSNFGGIRACDWISSFNAVGEELRIGAELEMVVSSDESLNVGGTYRE